jgi:serine/threonine-protein kinase HipA
MTKRFDRTSENEKLHVQTFCAMRHYDFNEVKLYSYEELFETMRELGLTYLEAQELYRRMVFNVLAKNCDDHTKNFAFLMDKSGQWRLSPAYDVCHAYRPGSDWVSQHALSINGKRKNFTREDILQIGKSMNIKNAKLIIEEVAFACSNWLEFANEFQVDDELKFAIQATHLKM